MTFIITFKNELGSQKVFKMHVFFFIILHYFVTITKMYKIWNLCKIEDASHFAQFTWLHHVQWLSVGLRSSGLNVRGYLLEQTILLLDA